MIKIKILVTGGAGFIGSHLVEALVEEGHDVIVLDDFSLGKEENLSSVKNYIQIVKGDVRDEILVKKLAKDINVIYNEAAASSSPMFFSNLKDAFSINVNGFINILNAAKENNAKVIYASTSVVYGNSKLPFREDMEVNPPNFYSASKLSQEHIAKIFSQEYGIDTIGLRYMSVYGPHEKSKGIYANLVSQFLWAMKKGEQPVIYGDGTQTRDFIYVKDVVQANILAMKRGDSSEIFNVGTGKSISLNELVRILNRILNTNIEPKYVECKVKNYMMSQQADLTKIRKMLGFNPKYDLEAGIMELLNFV